MITYKNTRKYGDAGLGDAIGYFARLGHTVLVPLTDSQDYDLVVDDDDGILRKVQVRATRQTAPSGSFVVGTRVVSGTTRKVSKYAIDAKYDLLYVVCGNGSRYLIPKSKIAVRSSITLSGRWTIYRLPELPYD